MSNFYEGQRILEPLTGIVGLPIDQLNFIICSLVAIGLGQVMRYQFSPSKSSPRTRMLVEILFGIGLILFCFGSQIKYMLIQSVVSYVLMLALPHRLSAPLVTAWSLIYMSVVHLYRMHYDYGGYTLDISGPVMIQTQRLSSMAFSLYDGYKLSRGETLKHESHKKNAIPHMPSPLRFFAYTFYFHGVLAGPFVPYQDYWEYITGYEGKTIPNADRALSRAFVRTLIHGLVTAYVAPQFPYLLVASIEFQKLPMSRRIIHSFISFFLVRQRYYFAWSICECAGLSAGLGYKGVKSNGKVDWSGVKNYDFMAIETGSSLKVVVDGWNITTARWLRQLIYERTPVWCRTLLVFVFSASWHGFYIGYYLMFLTFAVFTFCARIVRRFIRPHFQTNPVKAMGYDVFTIIMTNIALNYGQGPFYLLELQSAIMFWKPFYFFPHFVAMFVIISFKLRPKFGDIRVPGIKGMNHNLRRLSENLGMPDMQKVNLNLRRIGENIRLPDMNAMNHNLRWIGDMRYFRMNLNQTVQSSSDVQPNSDVKVKNS